VLADKLNLVVGHSNTLDTAYASSIGKNVTLHLLEYAVDEVVGEVEDKDRGVLDRILEGGVGHHIAG